MSGRQAKIITPLMQKRMLEYVSKSATPDRDRVIILLSLRAGMRAVEIAGLRWTMVLDPRGRIAESLVIHDDIAKKRGGRTVPMHPELRAALQALNLFSDATGPVIASLRGGHMQPNSIVNWFVCLFAALGFEGCSSHSGRRTFITSAARNLHRAGCSLRDVQMLGGHRSLETTERYIDCDTRGQRRLVDLL